MRLKSLLTHPNYCKIYFKIAENCCQRAGSTGKWLNGKCSQVLQLPYHGSDILIFFSSQE